MMRHTLQAAILGGLALVVVGCAKRPAELKRQEALDPECGGKGVAFSYQITTDSKLVNQATKAGCFAPIGAWTDERDAKRGGTRKLAYDLRENEKQTLLCCKN
jgi:hypothetical protein